ncbi:enterobactin/ferric enterobactin esterase [Rosistilla oblonga]|uniref:alpha/beta hydrolase n=1 Tax=Rosistilla oblonga TaxID=2527990 RepID=UPI001187EDCD|nr:alpha/beta hydrolase-fold protein [Rosistilla oblonga]QDV14167.1 enterobactin/ferric enterobactin esterase [Rosistilla oblonga]
MKYRSFALLLFSLCIVGTARGDDSQYKHGPDSKPREGVPQGKVTQHVWDKSKVFEGTKRRYSVYVPAQYDGSQPAALMVFQDGHAYESLKGDFRVPTVFDNLIHDGSMPITIAVMIDPGTKKELPEKRGWKPTPSNRSFEYDTLSADYSRLLLEEILPEVGKQYKITDNPKLRAIGGISSGGICAFTAAWERPDAFGKVLSHVGSFVNIRGGHNCEALIRKTPVKPIRVFLQDGSGDLDNDHGNWPLANQELAKSLAYKNYDYKFEYGSGGHNGKHGGAILPESLRWLWRDWKQETP